MKIFRYVGIATEVPVGLLEIDADPEAERVIVLDRITMLVVLQRFCRAGEILKAVLPDQYTNANQLAVVMLDDTGVFNAVVDDHVKLEKADARTVNLLP